MVEEKVVFPRRQRELESLVQKLGLPDRVQLKWLLLDKALTHPTFSPGLRCAHRATGPTRSNYEQLEFLGDAVVRMAASDLLLEIYPDCSVGQFSAIRKVLVSDRVLAQLADLYGLERYLLIDRNAARDQMGRQSRVADAFEAVLGALYLSTHTLELIRPWLDPHFKRLAAEIIADPAYLDYKSALQEWTQACHKVLPEYRTRPTQDNGKDQFTAEVWLLGQRYGTGKGRSRKAAEQAAAKEALSWVHENKKKTKKA
ncbi:MAG: ribonuclease III [Hormoscilla sp. GUM202]|nr:ribonuclease III [Hormoscilla sp. GUM202]